MKLRWPLVTNKSEGHNIEKRAATQRQYVKMKKVATSSLIIEIILIESIDHYQDIKKIHYLGFPAFHCDGVMFSEIFLHRNLVIGAGGMEILWIFLPIDGLNGRKNTPATETC